jgi:cell wall-associated NlpC family hydrolase
MGWQPTVAPQARLWSVPSAPTMVRATTALLVCAGGLAACGVARPRSQESPEAPSTTSVVNARFADPVDLDGGDLLVTPPPTRARVTVTESQADAMFEATDAVEGPHEFAILGLGLVTVAARVENPPTTTTTTAPPASSTTPSTTVPPSTAPPPPPTTTTAPTQPTTTTTTLPAYDKRLAWVGIVWGASESCPGSTTTRPASDGATSYVAVVIDARTGHRVIAYRSGSSPCTGATQAPSVSEPNELLSVPWQPVGPDSTAVQIQIPPCGQYYGWTQVATTGGTQAVQVVVAVPFDPLCGTTAAQSQAVDQVVPLGSGQSLVAHAPVGPVQGLQALPSN